MMSQADMRMLVHRTGPFRVTPDSVNRAQRPSRCGATAQRHGVRSRRNLSFGDPGSTPNCRGFRQTSRQLLLDCGLASALLAFRAARVGAAGHSGGSAASWGTALTLATAGRTECHHSEFLIRDLQRGGSELRFVKR